ncbi:MAG: spermidine/putrescine ABC transporter substrate-binding protein [Chloroflexota bacterium]
MIKRPFLILSFVTALLLVLAAGQIAPNKAAYGATEAATTSAMSATFAATDAPTPVATEAAVDGQKPVLNVYNWTTYIAEDTVSNFEKLYNVKVQYDTYGSNEELFAKLQAGNPGYDVVVPGDFNVQRMIKAGLLEDLDLKNLPNFTKNAGARFKNPDYDPDNKHCVAYQWGTMGIAYNIKKVGHEITGWSDVWTPGHPMSLFNSNREMMAGLLIALGKDPNTTNRADLDAVKDYVLKHKDLITSFHDDDGQTKLARGEVDIVWEWSGDIFQVMADNPDIRYVIPSEGTMSFTDNLCIPKGAKNKALAEKFINYIYDAKVGASISNFIGYGSPNQAAIDQGLINIDALTNPLIYPPAELVKKLHGILDIGDAQTMYDEVFADIKAGVGQ